MAARGRRQYLRPQRRQDLQGQYRPRGSEAGPAVGHPDRPGPRRGGDRQREEIFQEILFRQRFFRQLRYIHVPGCLHRHAEDADGHCHRHRPRVPAQAGRDGTEGDGRPRPADLRREDPRQGHVRPAGKVQRGESPVRCGEHADPSPAAAFDLRRAAGAVQPAADADGAGDAAGGGSEGRMEESPNRAGLGALFRHRQCDHRPDARCRTAADRRSCQGAAEERMAEPADGTGFRAVQHPVPDGQPHAASDCAAAERSPAADRQGDRRKAFHHAWRRPRAVQRFYCQLCRRRSDGGRNSRRLFKRRVYKGREVCKRRFGVHKFPFAADP